MSKEIIINKLHVLSEMASRAKQVHLSTYYKKIARALTELNYPTEDWIERKWEMNFDNYKFAPKLIIILLQNNESLEEIYRDNICSAEFVKTRHFNKDKKRMCIKCNKLEAKKKEKYCTECRKIILMELRASGTLPEPKNEEFSVHEQRGRSIPLSTLDMMHSPEEDSFDDESRP